MKDARFPLYFALLLVAQMLLWNYFNFSQLITITILPAMILLISTRRSTVFAMVLAFLVGFIVDFFTGGMLGLTSLALVPVGLLRKTILSLTYGQELFVRKEEISTRKYGWMKYFTSCTIANAIFFLIFVWADGAGMRPTYFNCLRILLSLTISTLLSLTIAPILRNDDNTKWM
ncbi:MAG: hypothetical protein MJY89_04670 [Bacteroidales bacterium]|nr:hypothetical protein [Bacteroidales bacterium]